MINTLPRVASIESMISGAELIALDGNPVNPWASKRDPLCGGVEISDDGSRRGGVNRACAVGDTQPTLTARLAQGRNIVKIYDGQCAQNPGGIEDADSPADEVNLCPNAGINLDLFPATTLYVTATVIDPAAKHWDPAQNAFVVGPVESHLFYQIAGQHPT